MDFCTKLFPGPGKEKFVLFVQLLSFLFMLMSLSSLKLHVGKTKKLSNKVYSVVGKCFSSKGKGNGSSNNSKVLSIQNPKCLLWINTLNFFPNRSWPKLSFQISQINLTVLGTCTKHPGTTLWTVNWSSIFLIETHKINI